MRRESWRCIWNLGSERNTSITVIHVVWIRSTSYPFRHLVVNVTLGIIRIIGSHLNNDIVAWYDCIIFTWF